MTKNEEGLAIYRDILKKFIWHVLQDEQYLYLPVGFETAVREGESCGRYSAEEVKVLASLLEEI